MNYKVIFIYHLLFLSIACHNNKKSTKSNDLQSNKVKSIIIFGDSLSDNGNVYHLSKITHSLGLSNIIPDNKMYPQHTFTNGEVWIDILIKSLNILPADRKKCFTTIIEGESCNYAFGSLTTSATTSIELPFFRKIRNMFYSLSALQNLLQYKIPSAIGIRELVEMYISNLKINEGKSKILFIIWGGGNDFLNNPELDSNIVLNNITSSITKIFSLQDNCRDIYILVPNLPNLYRLPYVLKNKEKYKNIENKIIEYNKLLSIQMSNFSLKYKNKIIYYDVYSYIEEIIRNNKSYNLENISQACLHENQEINCLNPRSYLFWDDVHPNSYIHCLIAKETQELLKAQNLFGNVVKCINC